MYIFEQIYREITDDLKSLCNNETIKLPDSPKTKVLTGYKLGKDNCIYIKNLQKYRSTIYRFLVNLPVCKTYFSQKHINSISKIEDLEDISKKLIDLFIYAFDMPSLEKYRKLLESNPILISTELYFNDENKWKMFNLVNGVLFGSDEQFGRIKLDTQNYLHDRGNIDFVTNFIDKLKGLTIKVSHTYSQWLHQMITIVFLIMWVKL